MNTGNKEVEEITDEQYQRLIALIDDILSDRVELTGMDIMHLNTLWLSTLEKRKHLRKELKNV